MALNDNLSLALMLAPCCAVSIGKQFFADLIKMAAVYGLSLKWVELFSTENN